MIFDVLNSSIIGSLKRRFMVSGQITKDSEIGRWLMLIASLSEVSTIVEIGTWNGQGSTKLLCLGVKQRPKRERDKVQFHGYEIHPSMFKKARRMQTKSNFLHIHHGSIIQSSDLDSQDLTTVERLWFDQDKRLIEKYPNVHHTVPNSIDLLVLDGGEFSTFAEFLTLRPRVVRWIVLDDTNVRKCKKIVDYLENDPAFDLVFESSERNGIAVYCRKKLE